MCTELGRTPRLPARGPFLLTDQVGMGVSVEMLMKAVKAEGRIADSIQHDTMRKYRSTYTKMWSSSPIRVSEGSSFSGFNRRVSITSAPTQSDFFGNFLVGAKDRMGYQTKNQLSVPIGAVVRLIELIDIDISTSEDPVHTKLLTRFGALVTLKIFTEAEARALPRVCICLLGKFKGETGERYHSIILANESTSGLRTRKWIERLMVLCDEEGRTSGYAFCDSNGQPPSPTEYNALVRHYIQIIQEEDENLFDTKSDITRYGISRTFRKTSETRARRAGIPKEQVEMVNQWRKVECAGGRKPNFDMADHYSDASQLGTLMWRYSYAL
eukprot:CCRYP_017722-RA/>CCRYP_017722-RA protein AED:0.41 eAED:0.41 QI:0/-1/0/1/-1/1/1/0/326